MTSSEAFGVYREQYESPKYRESVYRELENLVEAGLVEKRYDSDEKQLTYAVRSDVVCFELGTGEVRTKTRDQG